VRKGKGNLGGNRIWHTAPSYLAVPFRVPIVVSLLGRPGMRNGRPSTERSERNGFELLNLQIEPVPFTALVGIPEPAVWPALDVGGRAAPRDHAPGAVGSLVRDRQARLNWPSTAQRLPRPPGIFPFMPGPLPARRELGGSSAEAPDQMLVGTEESALPEGRRQGGSPGPRGGLRVEGASTIAARYFPCALH
jgi:hypothetical protein